MKDDLIARLRDWHIKQAQSYRDLLKLDTYQPNERNHHAVGHINEHIAFHSEAADALSSVEGGGWKLVPVEPTEAMIAAGADRISNNDDQLCDTDVGAALMGYRAMIAVAPSAPTPPIPAEVAEALERIKHLSGDWNSPVMDAWDRSRAALLSGNKGSLPRDIMEAALSEIWEVAEEASRLLSILQGGGEKVPDEVVSALNSLPSASGGDRETAIGVIVSYLKAQL